MSTHVLGKFYNIHDPEWDVSLAAMRKLVREKNKVYSWVRSGYYPGYYPSEKKIIWKIVPRYRLGKNNPHAHHYHRGGEHWRWTGIRINREHAQYCTLYLIRTTIWKSQENNDG